VVVQPQRRGVLPVRVAIDQLLAALDEVLRVPIGGRRNDAAVQVQRGARIAAERFRRSMQAVSTSAANGWVPIAFRSDTATDSSRCTSTIGPR